MGLIRVSDETEQRIKEIKGEKSVGAVVDDLLTKNDIAARMDKMAAYLAEMRAELLSAIQDTTIDRVATSYTYRPKPKRQAFISDWQTARTVLYDIAKESDYVNPALYDSFVNSDMADEFSYYVQDDQLRYTWHGGDFPILNLTPAITSYLTEKGVL